MKYEVEQKFRLPDPADLEKRIAKLGARLGEPVLQVDRYFAHPARDFAQTDEALRIRSVGEQNFVTYKGPKIDATTKTRRELELPIEAGALGAVRFGELLENLGFRAVAAVEKRRRTAHLDWQHQTVEIVADDVTGVGEYCELEMTAEAAQVDAARQVLADLATHLGLAESERRSYLELLLGR